MKRRDTPIPSDKLRLIILLLSAGAVLFLAAGAYFLFGERETVPPEATASFCFQLGVWEDRLAVYTAGGRSPAEVLDIPLAALPEPDRQLLKDGIPLRDEEELRRAIEDYS